MRKKYLSFFVCILFIFSYLKSKNNTKIKKIVIATLIFENKFCPIFKVKKLNNNQVKYVMKQLKKRGFGSFEYNTVQCWLKRMKYTYFKTPIVNKAIEKYKTLLSNKSLYDEKLDTKKCEQVIKYIKKKYNKEYALHTLKYWLYQEKAKEALDRLRKSIQAKKIIRQKKKKLKKKIINFKRKQKAIYKKDPLLDFDFSPLTEDDFIFTDKTYYIW